MSRRIMWPGDIPYASQPWGEILGELGAEEGILESDLDLEQVERSERTSVISGASHGYPVGKTNKFDTGVCLRVYCSLL